MGLLDNATSSPAPSALDDINDRLMSAGGSRFHKWGEEIGAAIEGTVVSAEYRQATKFGTTEPDTYPDGNPKMDLHLTIATAARSDDEDDDGTRIVALSYRLQKQLSKLLKDQGVRLQVGGVFAMKWTSGRGTSSSPREFAMAYKAPTVEAMF
jgi:hypothetical protein